MVNTIFEAREGRLVELATKTAEAARQPLDHGTTNGLTDLAHEIQNVTGHPLPNVA